MAPAWRLSAAVGSGRIFYETFLGDGNMYITQVGLAHALGRATLLRADGAFRSEAVDSEAYSWREFIVGTSATRELSRGFLATAGSTYRLRRYDRPIAAFGPEARQDGTLAGRMKVSNRHVELFGFMAEPRSVMNAGAAISYQLRELSTFLSPLSRSDGHDCFGLIDELVPGLATGLNDGVVIFEDAVREPVLSEVLSDVLDRV